MAEEDGLTIKVDTGELNKQLSKITNPLIYQRAIVQSALLVETQIKANASGRPGPRVVTGNYRRSWNTRIVKTGDGISAVVGTNAVYGPRLEYGFSGTDSLGRNYNQPPFPHVAPALAQTEPKVVKLIEAAVDAAITLAQGG